MRTSEEIYHRVRWDPRFDPARFTLGILVRGAPPKRVALPAFVPGGDIPWHRVLFVEADGEVVWDRATGVDRIDESAAGRVREPRRLRAPFFSARSPIAGGSALPSASLRVLTWNTLWDRYDSDRIDTARRRPLLLDALARADVDVIALQEVEPALLTMLLTLPGYTVCGADDVEDCGLLLLSRLPVLEAGHHALSRHKGVAAVVVRDADGPVAVLNTHLTSDHHPEGAHRREAELARLTEGLADIGCPVVLLGDFNGGATEGLGLVDTWSVVRGDETPTFDPAVNPLAAVSSTTGRASRLDRVLVRGFRPVAAELLGTVAPFVSDHYGVAVELGAVSAAVPVAPAEPVPVPALDGVVHVVGSRRMGCARAGADLDLVLVTPDPALITVPGAEEVVGGRVPGLRFRHDGVRVDLTIVGSGDLPPGSAVSRRAELGPAAAMALSAVTDAEAVLAAVGDRHAEFAWLARHVKAWAAARGVDSAAHGGLPGLAWAVLAARTVRSGGDDLLAEFFGGWAAWDWREPVALLGAAAPTSAPMTIMTPSEPVRSCTEQVGPGMRDLVTAELYAAWETVTAGGDPLPAAAPHRRHAAWAVITVPAVEAGRVRGRMRALLTALEAAGVEDAHAWPAPFDRAPVRYAVGLGRTPPSAAELAALAGPWCPPGVTVEWTDGSAVPALPV